MEYNIIDNAKTASSLDPFDEYTGLGKNAWGGSELMYNRLMTRLGAEYSDRFQFISSRVRKLIPEKKHILILNDTWDDPESAHLANPESRDKFAHLAFVSNYQFNTYNKGLGVPYKNSSVMKNAIYPIEGERSVSDNVRLIYHTTPHRGLEILIPVFLEISKIRPNVTLDVYSSFNIYGWKERDRPYEHLFETCRNHPNINYHGDVSNDRVRQALRSADIFAYPCIHEETSCIAAIEAMSAGLAIVAPDYGALPETLFTYGYMYRWTEDINEHANRFATVLMGVIDNIHADRVKENLIYQQKFANAHYNMDSRVDQWKKLLDTL
jgi:glycosyltransferase involved in cell wall biosynthesis